MTGVSYYAVAAKLAGARNPTPLKALFSPWGYTDHYRHRFYHGGILGRFFVAAWPHLLANPRVGDSWSRQNLSEEEFNERLAAAREDEDLLADPTLAAVLAAPNDGVNPLLVDVLLNDLDSPYWEERRPYPAGIGVPTVTGSDWATYGLHLPGDVRTFEEVPAEKRLIIGPPVYLDRPVYQYAYESLRWFDAWCKGADTGIDENPPVRLFVPGRGDWVTSDSWPLPQTRWTPFNLHAGRLLSEHEFWPGAPSTNFQDNAYNEHGSLVFTTPPLVENTEVIGPARLVVHASTTDTELLWFASLWDVPPEGPPELLTRGWLRGSLRATDPEQSTPWYTHHPFTKRESLTPGEVYEFSINLVSTARFLPAGHRIAVKLATTDEEQPKAYLEAIAQGHLRRQRPAWITVHHSTEYPSHLLLPVTAGNIIGTYLSGGQTGPRPVREVLGRTPWRTQTRYDEW